MSISVCEHVGKLTYVHLRLQFSVRVLSQQKNLRLQSKKECLNRVFLHSVHHLLLTQALFNRLRNKAMLNCLHLTESDFDSTRGGGVR